MIVQTATPADAPSLVALINRAFAVEKFFVDHERTTLQQVQAHLSIGTFLVVPGENVALAACVYVEQRGQRAYVGLLAVDPSQQRRGLGRLMMDAAERRAADLGCRGIDIRVVNLRAELPPFYRSRGYVDRGEQPLDDPGLKRPAHFILMGKELSS